jgi:hypothetical protein
MSAKLKVNQIISALKNKEVSINGESYTVKSGKLLNASKEEVTPKSLNTTWSEIYDNNQSEETSKFIEDNKDETLDIISMVKSSKESLATKSEINDKDKIYKSHIEVVTPPKEELVVNHFLTPNIQNQLRDILSESESHAVIRLIRSWKDRELKNTITWLTPNEIKEIHDEVLYWIEKKNYTGNTYILLKKYDYWKEVYPELFGVNK